jgi:soluble lytic murein transglycosylase
VGAPAADERWDLGQFRPVLALPELSSVHAAVLDGEIERAVKAFSAWLEQNRSSGEEQARRLYTLALLQRSALDFARAAETLQALSEMPTLATWILRDDATLLRAETLIEAGRATDALAVLSQEHGASSGPEAVRRWSLAARAHVLLAEPALAIPAWREVVRADPLALEARLALAESLLAAAANAPAQRQGAAREALEFAEPIALVLPPEHVLGPRVAAVIGEARQLGAQPSLPSSAAQLLRLETLVEGRDWQAAEGQLSQIRPADLEPNARCQLAYLHARVLAGQSHWGAAADRLTGAAVSCETVPELHAKILFNAGKFAAADGRDPVAVRHYAELERRYPESTLADDARVRQARSYLDMGSVARFTELLLALPVDYPAGDLTMEGVLDLALYRMERRDWAGAAGVLERGARALGARDRARGPEESGRERYFWARSLAQLGERKAALDHYESIIIELPLSYYMLHAYSRLYDADPARAEVALELGLDSAQSAPFTFPHRPEYETVAFRRGMELLRVGDAARGRSVLDGVGLGEGTDDTLLWGLALLYDRAGEVQVAHGIARGRLSDWLGHYPEGDWQRPWEIGFPRPYESIVRRESQASGVPEWFIYGVMREESTFDAGVKSHADAYGLMQLIVPTARSVGIKYGLPHSPEALKRPSVNIALGSRVLESLGRQFKDNPPLAIPGYNAGPGRPRRWLRERPDTDFDLWVELIPIRETRRYTKRVLASRAAYAFLYYRDQADHALRLPLRLTPP